MSKCFLAFLIFIGCACRGGTNAVWRDSELVRSPGVVYSLRYITLTRCIEELSRTTAEGRADWSVEKTRYNSIYRRGDARSNSRATGYSSRFEAGWRASAGLSWGFIPDLHLGAEVGGGRQTEEIVRDYRGACVSRTNTVDYTRGVGTTFGRSETSMSRLGNFKIELFLSFRGQSPDELFHVGGPGASVSLDGLGRPVLIPFTEEFDLGCDERLCRLELELKDSDAVAAALNDVDWDAVSVSLSGSQLPIVAKATGENVLQRLAREEARCATTEIAIEGSDGKLNGLSPWRIQTKFPRRSGKGGRAVTIGEAVNALNQELAKDEYLPKETLGRDRDGRLATVNGQALGKVRKEGARLLVPIVCLEGRDEAEIWMEAVPQAVLERPLGTFGRIGFSDLDVEATAEAFFGPGLHLNGVKGLETKTRQAFLALAARDARVKDAIDAAKKHAAEWERAQEEEARKNVVVAGITLVRIPGRNLLFGQTEVTQGQWYSIMGQNPSRWQVGDDQPVECVSHLDAQAFINKLNERADVRARGLRFRLPGMLEWQAACRAGSSGRWGARQDGRPGQAEDMAWFNGNALGKPHRVKTKAPNAWGLFDLHGNVWEWCFDERGGAFVIAGGSYSEEADKCHTEAAATAPADQKSPNIGIRVVAVED